MADLNDVTAAMLSIAGGAVYPNGQNAASVINAPVKLFEGWPNAAQLDLDMAGNMLSNGAVVPNGLGPIANVSIFPMASAGAQVFQVLDKPYVIVPPVHGLLPSLNGQTIILDGAPTPGEFLTIIADFRNIYSRGGADAASICAAIAADARADYPSASANGNTVTIPAQDFWLRIGAPATMGQVTHRQRQTVIVSIWAPTPDVRSTLGAAVDVAMKQNLRISMQDTSQAVMTYDRVIQSDSWETTTVYRRDLYYVVEYATLEQWTSYEVTSVTTTWAPQDQSAYVTKLNWPPPPPSLDFGKAADSSQIPLIRP